MCVNWTLYNESERKHSKVKLKLSSKPENSAAAELAAEWLKKFSKAC